VFYYAGDFNGDLSTWGVFGKVTGMAASTYTCFLFFVSFVHWFYFWTMLSPFLSLNFSLCSVCLGCCLQWWSLRLEGRESDGHEFQYVIPPLHSFCFPSNIGSLFWLVFSPSFVPTNVLELFPLFFQPFLFPWTFCYFCGAVFLEATAFNGDLSAWDVGNVTVMRSSTSTLP